MVTRSEAFPSRYVKADDVGRGVKWVIADVAMADFKEDNGITKRKLVASFQDNEKLWVVNVTNYNIVAELFGEDTDEWIGKEIVLYSAKVQFGPKMVDGIRARAPKPQRLADPGYQISSGPEAKPVRQQAAAPHDDMDQEIPF